MPRIIFGGSEVKPIVIYYTTRFFTVRGINISIYPTNAQHQIAIDKIYRENGQRKKIGVR